MVAKSHKKQKIDGINVKPQQHISDPKAVALSDMSGHDYSRIEADDLSDRIHALLKKQGIGKDDVVLINLKRSARHKRKVFHTNSGGIA